MFTGHGFLNSDVDADDVILDSVSADSCCWDLPKSPSGEEGVQAFAIFNVGLSIEEDPNAGVRKRIRMRCEGAYQLSAHKTFLAAATRHGSVCIGEFKILRAYSLFEAITMKLAAM